MVAWDKIILGEKNSKHTALSVVCPWPRILTYL